MDQKQFCVLILYSFLMGKIPDTDDAERSGRPNEVVTPENIKKHNIVLSDGKMKLRFEYEKDLFKLGAAFARARANERSGFWSTVNDSEQCFAMFKRNKPEFLYRYVTMDESWIHHFTPESKQLSPEWTETDDRPTLRLLKDKSFYKSSTEMLEQRCNDCVAVVADYVSAHVLCYMKKVKMTRLSLLFLNIINLC
ncbi:hypothetical protein GWI33_008166 [Rhynchophorus ferrugineus]|uniref:Uncharacterized protein n=1 Tax=Rhynchophorus ferrugineus TaxID=354439 RepID=A0A834IRG3_RHYFE|nr:hypothetical protein GWI33_008166 [Rhynchophorus ferrugineus]